MNYTQQEATNRSMIRVEPPTNIVLVRYYSSTNGGMSAREYSYYAEEPLVVGDVVLAPVGENGSSKAQVTAVNVPEITIVAFRDKVKTIPAKARILPIVMLGEIRADALKGVDTQDETIPPSPHLSQPDIDITETSLVLRPGEDIEVHWYFLEAIKLLDYAEHRAIKTLDDAQTATNDLSIISKLKKAMDAKRKEKLAPHEAQVKAIRDTYTYLMTPVLEAERITKSKQVAFLQEQERIKREQEEINRKRMEAAQAEMKLKGELTESVNLVEVTEAPEHIRAELGVTGMVDHWVFEVVDFSQVPDEYKVVDSTMLNAIARKYHDQKPVRGIRFVNQPYIATRTK